MTGGPGLSRETRALVRFAVGVATGREALLADRAIELTASGTPVPWVDELLLQSVLMVGYPRALVAAGVWRRTSGVAAPATDASLAESRPEWERRGEATCRVVYGKNYDRLRQNVQALHPALDAWMVVEGYGRVLSRPGLDLQRRELCTIAQIAWLDSPHQLHSHLQGALHAGASAAVIEEVLALAADDLSEGARESAMSVWSQMKARWLKVGES